MTNRYDEKKSLTKPSIITATILIAIIAASPLIVTQNIALAQAQQAEPGSVLKLSRASIPIDIPLEKGYRMGMRFSLLQQMYRIKRRPIS